MSKGCSRSPETRAKISASLRGNKPWNAGLTGEALAERREAAHRRAARDDRGPGYAHKPSPRDTWYSYIDDREEVTVVCPAWASLIVWTADGVTFTGDRRHEAPAPAFMLIEIGEPLELRGEATPDEVPPRGDVGEVWHDGLGRLLSLTIHGEVHGTGLPVVAVADRVCDAEWVEESECSGETGWQRAEEESET